MKTILIATSLALLAMCYPTAVRADDVIATSSATTDIIPTYPEIPYYIRQLNEATTERKRIEMTKILHNAIVNADLADKRTVKTMEPMIEKVKTAIAAGLDRAYLEGSSMWLGSAVDYFEREKLQPTVNIPESDWHTTETVTQDGGQLSINPDKIWLINKNASLLVAESSNIHEAVITPDGKRAAFIRESNDQTRAEIWVVNMKNKVRKKITSVPSCYTLLLTNDGNKIFFQEKPASADKESTVWVIHASGGSPKKVGTVRLLQTVVQKGPHKNALIVYKQRLHPLGIAHQECAYAWDGDGKNVGRLTNITCH